MLMESELPLWLEHRLTSALFLLPPVYSCAERRTDPALSARKGLDGALKHHKVTSVVTTCPPPRCPPCPRPATLPSVLRLSSAQLLLRDAVRCGPAWLSSSGSG